MLPRLAPRAPGQTPTQAEAIGLVILLFIGQCLAACAAMALTRLPGSTATVWPCAAITLVALLLRPRHEAPALLLSSGLGILLGGLLAGMAPVSMLVLSLVGQAEAWGAALVMRHSQARRVNLARPRDLGRFGVLVLMAPSLSGLVAAGYMARVWGVAFPATWGNWAMAHMLGLALVVPVALAAFGPGRPPRQRKRPARALALHGALSLAVVAVFLSPGEPLLFLLFPPMLALVWRLGLAGATTGVAMVAALGLPLATLEQGGLQLGNLAGRSWLLQLFLLVVSATALPLSALLETHRRLRGAQLRQAEEVRRQALLLDNILAAMEQGLAAFDRGGRLLAANGRYAELVGLPTAMVTKGRHYLELARWLARKGDFGPGDPELLAQERYRNNSAGRVHRANRVRPDGRSLEFTNRPLPSGGWVTTVSDMTGREARERRLAESEASFRLLTENSGDVIARLGLDGVFRYVSPAALRVLGWQPQALCGQPMLDFVQAEDRAWVSSSVVALAQAATEEITITFRFRREDESEVWVEAHVRLLLDPGGRPLEAVLAMRDATDRKAAETELLAAFERMEAMAQTDGLTGLANRRRFDEMLGREWRRAMRDETPLSLLLVDADRFKTFNDRYGHAAGDECLRHLAVAIGSAARRPGDLAARYGGEEFVVLLPATDLLGAQEVAERLRQEVLAIGLEHLGNPPMGLVSVSIGLACAWPRAGEPVDTDGLLRAADDALYVAKSTGRNQVSSGATQVAA